MPAEKISVGGLVVDMSQRIFQSTTVVASPAAAAETIIASLTVPANASLGLGVLLEGWAAFTVGTSGTAANLRIRQTNVSGTVLCATGALTVTAANLVSFSLQGVDTAAVLPGQIYVLTLQVTAGAAASTVSGTQLVAQAV